MADSNITKSALASALQELIKTEPLEKITVAQICERCNMNRKSFYYHFKDKYDLVNWIFDTDLALLRKETERFSDSYEDRWAVVLTFCEYFYARRSFYQRALRVEGQNSLSEHLQETFFLFMYARITELFNNELADEFTLTFFADAFVCAIKRWLLARSSMTPQALVGKLRLLIEVGARTVYDILPKE